MLALSTITLLSHHLCAIAFMKVCNRKLMNPVFRYNLFNRDIRGIETRRFKTTAGFALAATSGPGDETPSELEAVKRDIAKVKADLEEAKTDLRDVKIKLQKAEEQKKEDFVNKLEKEKMICREIIASLNNNLVELRKKENMLLSDRKDHQNIFQKLQNKGMIEEDEARTVLLNNLLDYETLDIGAGVTAVKFKGENKEFKVATNVLFFRSFYDDLLCTLRKRERAVLLGNPGIGKSMFQFYYLWRIFTEKGIFPADFKSNTNVPKFVLRQIGAINLIIYDVEKQKVWKTIHSIPYVLDSFNSAENLYLYEPGGSFDPPFYEEKSMSILATVSPNERRYKEFVKSGAVIHYMPCYTEEELVAVGKYIREEKLAPKEIEEGYNEENVLARIKEFGGIFRHVFPPAMTLLTNTRSKKVDALKSINSKIFNGMLDRSQGSYFLVRYNVLMTGDRRFTEASLNFVSEDVRESIEREIEKWELADIRKTLINDDELYSVKFDCPKVFEMLVLQSFTTGDGVAWKKQIINPITEGKSEWQPFEVKLSKVSFGKLPTFENMEIGTFYYSSSKTFPAFDCCYRDKDGLLHCFQLSRQKDPTKAITLSAMKAFMSSIGCNDYSKLKIYLIPHYRVADKAKISFKRSEKLKKKDTESDEDCEAKNLKLKLEEDEILKNIISYDVIKTPTKYERSF